MLLKRPVVLAVLGLGAALFLVRGPLRALGPGSGDLAQPFAGAVAWARGEDPYDSALTSAILLDRGREAVASVPIATPPLYPPSTFALLSVLAPWRWGAARLIYLAGATLALGLSTWAILRTYRLKLSEPPGLIVGAVALASAPVHTAFAVGQPMALAGPMVIGSLCASVRGHDVTAGILLGLAILLKPQAGAHLVLLFLILGRRRVLASSLAVGTLVGGVALGWLLLHRPHALGTLLQNAHEVSTLEFAASGPLAHQMVNLGVLASVIPDRGALQAIVLGSILGIALVALVAAAWRFRGRTEEITLLYGGFTFWGLLAIYHRTYDLIPLLPVVAWAVGSRRESASPSRELLLLMSPFLVPGAAVLKVLTDAGSIPAFLVGAWWWNVFVVRYQPWLLLSLLAVATVACLRMAASGPNHAGARR